MTQIIFVRHGQTEWNKLGRYQGQANVPLSEVGRKQAAALAAKFPIENVDVIYSSDLDRARETAETFARNFGLEVHPDTAFREIFFGDWEGLTYDQICEGWPNMMDKFFTDPDKMRMPNGEGFQDVQDRAVQRLKEIIAENEGKTIAIAAHGGVIRTMLVWILHMDLKYMWTLRQDNTAVNVIDYRDGVFTVRTINDIHHLDEMKESVELEKTVDKQPEKR